jgi:hypothetical protein
MTASLAPEMMEELKGLSSADLEQLRAQAKHDLFFMSRGVLGYEALTEHTHAAPCNFLVREEKIRRMYLDPRGHFKSSNGTIADPIRISVANPDHARILIANETATNAEGFLAEIKGHWEHNQVLRFLFSELVPERFTGPGSQWASTMATIRRNTSYKEGTYTAIGLGGAATSRHYTRIKIDDIIGLEASRSPAEMKMAMEWLDQIEPLLTAPDVDIIDFIGTRWSLIDAYAHLMEAYGSELAIFSRMATDNGEPDGNPIFPERFSRDRFARIKRINPGQWYAQYCNNPIASGARDFEANLVRTWWWNQKGEIEYRDEGELKTWKLEDLYVTIQVDPNSGSSTAPDTAAIITNGVSPLEDVFVLDAFSGRPQVDELLDTLYTKACRWNPRAIGIEKAGQSTTLWQFEQHMKRQGRTFNVVPLHHQNKEKEDRIRQALQPLVQMGKLFLSQNQTILRHSIANFPQIKLWDELDALAYGPKLWRKGVSVESLDRARENRHKLLAARGITGYGGGSMPRRMHIRRQREA